MTLQDEDHARQSATEVETRRWVVAGRVQGVGFRPFIYNLAGSYRLDGWVRNDVGQVTIVAQGEVERLERFGRAILEQAPPLARPRILSCGRAAPVEGRGFAILPSRDRTPARVHVPPDYFACDECIRELADPSDRRFQYPFINCTQCGPRYTLIRSLPYDRPNTTMAAFAMCDACRAEYKNPADRRFHAQPVACIRCGPRLEFTRREAPADPMAVPSPAPAVASTDPLARAINELRAGRIIAIKGIGGYHLMCDACNADSVARLRAHKPRPHKPLAVMVPPPDTDSTLDRVVEIDDAHRRLLLDPMRPIVLSAKRPDAPLADGIAPGLAEVGVFLPYSPLHHLLLDRFGGPLVATSANVSGEPVLTDNREVTERLGHVAEAFLHHDRPIERPADDPVYRIIDGVARPVRLGRGGAPLELELPFRLDRPVLAVGGHMKNTIALAWHERVVVSPHIGELDAPRSLDVFERVIDDLQRLYQVRAEVVICDAHPGYTSSRWARASSLEVVEVLHHVAHAAAIAGEQPQVSEWIAFTWDGVGYGGDGALWGGETFVGRPGAWRRAGSFRPFRLPGGEAAGRDPWRSALAVCWETGRSWDDAPGDVELLRKAWERGLNAPVTTAVGRLFDAAAALGGVLATATYEGQGPMLLEALAQTCPEAELLSHRIPELPIRSRHDDILEVDWEPLIDVVVDGTRSISIRSGLVHAALAAALVEQAKRLRSATGIDTVGFSGGVFQNRVLAERCMRALRAAGFEVHLPIIVPANDGGLCFGQVIEYGGAIKP
jgi:hydrogenase maturation protein HypF